MRMPAGASSFNSVGISSSDFGLLELMWYPSATRKRSVAVADCPAATLTGAVASAVTQPAEDFAPLSARNPAPSKIATAAAITTLFIAPPWSPAPP